MHTPFATVIISVSVLGACAGAAAQEEAQSTEAPVQQRWAWPDNPENLQVLPEQDGGALRAAMVGFTQALGVRCSYCHIGSGPDLTTYDFVADTNPNKQTARAMMRMTRAINEQYLAEIDGHVDAQVTCYSCHRGATHPLTRPPVDASN